MAILAYDFFSAMFLEPLRGDESFLVRLGGRYVPRDEDRDDLNTPLPGESFREFMRRRRAGKETSGSR